MSRSIESKNDAAESAESTCPVDGIPDRTRMRLVRETVATFSVRSGLRTGVGCRKPDSNNGCKASM
jgi:hypothetical protein